MNEILQNGTYIGNAYSQYYSLELSESGNVFLNVAGDSGASGIYDENLNFISNIASTPIYLEAGSYVVNTKYSSPNLAALSVYIPQLAKSSDLVDLNTGSYVGSTWDHYYDLNISAGKNVLIDVYGDRGNSAVYDQALNFVADITSAPMHLDAGSYIVHAAYSSKNQAGLTINIPIDPNPPPVTSINETLTGTVADESLTGGTGDDTIDGGAGTDKAAYSGARSNYTVTNTTTGYTVKDATGADGTDTLINVEQLQFVDHTVNLAQMDRVFKYFVAYYGRAPASTGKDYWLDNLSGTFANDEKQLVWNFGSATQAEFINLYGSGGIVSDFVSKVYSNLFNRTPLQTGLDYWGGVYDDKKAEGKDDNAIRGEMVTWIMDGATDSATNKDLTTLNNKVLAASMFTAAVDTPAELGGYRIASNTAALDYAREWLHEITNDSTTLNSHLDSAALDQTIVQLVGLYVPVCACRIGVAKEKELRKIIISIAINILGIIRHCVFAGAVSICLLVAYRLLMKTKGCPQPVDG